MADADVQIVLQNQSNLPRDRFINTLAFSASGVGTFGSFAAILAADLATAWAPLGVIYPTNIVKRLFEIRIYNPDDAKPRPPWKNGAGAIPTGTLVAASQADGLPTEVALCLSYYGVSNTKRNRGRMYIGPLHPGFMASTRPTADLQTHLLDLATRLSAIGGSDVDWQIHSRVANTRQRIQKVWVDNAWDTQRRRGLDSTGRVTRDVTG